MICYVVLAGLISVCAMITLKPSRTTVQNISPEADPESQNASLVADNPADLKVRQRIRWVLLAFAPSSLLLGVTNYITTDIAQVPLFWIIPLAIYLTTFILVFSPKPVFRHKLMVRVQPFFIIPIVLLFYWGFPMASWVFIPLHLLVFFVIAMVCHGNLANTRPSTIHLTEFYIWLSVGGVLGGLFNALVTPMVFDTLVEYPLVIVLACLLRPSPDLTVQKERARWFDIGLPLTATVIFGISRFGLGRVLSLGIAWSEIFSGFWLIAIIFISCFAGVICLSFSDRPIRFGLGVGGLMLAGVLCISGQNQVLYSERNFFGFLKVLYEPESDCHLLFHGTTLHGAQSLNPTRKREPLTYYHRSGSLGQLFASFSPNQVKRRIAIIGLGTGTIACYGKPGQFLTFYEIDPALWNGLPAIGDTSLI